MTIENPKQFEGSKMHDYTVNDAHSGDGPCHPFTWRHRGEPIDDQMQPAAWWMVNHLMSCRDLAATFAELKQPVYDEREYTADHNAFGSLRRAANRFFASHGIGLRVCIKKRLVFLQREI